MGKVIIRRICCIYSAVVLANLWKLTIEPPLQRSQDLQSFTHTLWRSDQTARKQFLSANASPPPPFPIVPSCVCAYVCMCPLGWLTVKWRESRGNWPIKLGQFTQGDTDTNLISGCCCPTVVLKAARPEIWMEFVSFWLTLNCLKLPRNVKTDLISSANVCCPTFWPLHFCKF